jgi:3-isopropylmalate dehydrogenase
MLPSASLNSSSQGMYEPCHGSAPDIAGENIANPIAAILSLGMMFKYSFNEDKISDLIDHSISEVLNAGNRTKDIGKEGDITLSCDEMGDHLPFQYL